MRLVNTLILLLIASNGFGQNTLPEPFFYANSNNLEDCGASVFTITAANCQNSELWDLMSVDWSFGDGSFETTLELTTTHQYFIDETVQVTAVAHYLNINDNSVYSVNVLYSMTDASNSSQDPCASNIGITGVDFLEFPTLYASVELNTSQITYGSADIVDIFFNVNDFNTDLYEIEFTLDGTAVSVNSYSLPSTNELIYSASGLSEGTHIFAAILKYKDNACKKTFDVVFEILRMDDDCELCNTFTPEVGKKYWVSAWVKEQVSSQVKSYENASLSLGFEGSSQPVVSFTSAGNIIDGWQRIVGSFIIPANTQNLNINLINSGSNNVYFDDIRIHPYNSSMKSYVYDPQTLWLTAELDDNNYATFYEYDKEGNLIRIKKETARGVMTIQESRSKTLKSN